MPLPDRLLKGWTFSDGDTVNAAKLNALVDEGTALPGFITELAAVTAVPTDYVVISDTSAGGALKKALVSDLPEGVTSVAMTVPSGFNVTVTDPTGAVAIAVATPNQAAGKFYASPEFTTGVPAFRSIASVDLTLSPVDVLATTIDWHAGNVFNKVVPNTGTFTFNHANSIDGQTIRVRIQQGTSPANAVVLWSATPQLYWRDNGTLPVLPVGPGRRNIYTFTRIGTIIYGYADLNFALPP